MNSNIFRLKNYKLGRTFTLNVCKFKKTNHYDCLGITPKATQGDIKTAYYKLSKQYHPDMNKEDAAAAEKFRDITTAYEVLGNLKSRKVYDRGLFVGANDEIYTPEETDYNIQHASFHKQRNKPIRQRPTEKYANYDIDEWTRAHYSSTFSSSYKYKTAESENIKREEDSLQEQKSVLEMVTVAGIILVIFGLIFGNTKSDFDKPVLSAVYKKPDEA